MKKIFQILLLTFLMYLIIVNNDDCFAQNTNNKIHLNIDSVLKITAGNRPLLSYQFNTVYPPAGVDTNFKRSGFIHPLYTPHGQLLTRIQPPDHFHHYGIWNPWTHTLFENDTIDFWNIKAHTGTVRFAGFTAIDSGVDYVTYTALHEHVVFKKNGAEKIALKEWQTVKVYQLDTNNNYYKADITSSYQCASESPLLLLAYRYGGLGWRATEYWDKNNCEVLTSEGNNRQQTDGTKARWVMATGLLPGNDSGGMLILSHPGNYNYPEPLRIWDQSGNKGRGDLFINFSPTKDKDWLLEPGKTYGLKYRLIVFNGAITKNEADKYWQSFSLGEGAK